MDWQPDTLESKALSPEFVALLFTVISGADSLLNIAQRIYDWGQHWSQRDDGPRLEKVVVELPDGRRFLLHNMSTQEIAETLALLQRSDT